MDIDFYKIGLTPEELRDAIMQLRRDFDAHNHDGSSSRSFETLTVKSIASLASLAVRKTGYNDNTAGFWVGIHVATAKMFVGNATNFVKWDGSTLSITGSISGSTITGGTFQTASGSTKKVVIDGTNNRVEWYDNAGGLSGYIVGAASGMDIGTATFFRPVTDNALSLGSSSNRWSDVRSVLINGADICLENGWKLREWPLKRKDVGRPATWIKKHANQGIQILDDKERVIAIIHKDGYIYCRGVRPLSDIIKT